MNKKLLVGLVALGAALSASAEFRWGPTVGLNIDNLHWKQNLLAKSQIVGPQVGVMGEVMIPGIGFGVDFGLRYSQLGATLDFGEYKVWNSLGIGKETLRIHSLQIPLDLRFKWTRMNGVEDIIAPFAYGGPVFCFNLANNVTEAVDCPAGYLAVQCGLGAELFKRWQISAGYVWGVSYITRTILLDNYSAQSRNWNVSVTYLF